MMSLHRLLVLGSIVLSFASVANAADGRQFGLYGGFGFSRTAATVQQPGVSTTLTGWGNQFEGGLDVPFSGNWGSTFAAEIGEADLRNNYKSDDYLDQTTIKSKSARAGIYFKNLTLGYGVRQLVIDLKTVSSTMGASSSHLEGNGSFGYAAFSIDHREKFRGTLEVQANTIDMSGFAYTDYTVGLRAYVLLNGLLD